MDYSTCLLPDYFDSLDCKLVRTDELALIEYEAARTWLAPEAEQTADEVLAAEH